jgi:hypothetical protein
MDDRRDAAMPKGVPAFYLEALDSRHLVRHFALRRSGIV